MVRKYVPKGTQQKWTEASIRNAIEELANGAKICATAKKYCIPHQTLSYKWKEFLNSDNGGLLIFKKHVGRLPIFSEEMEQALYNKIVDFQRRLYGLSPKEVRQYAFRFAERLKIPHPFNKDNCEAGEDWYRGFMQRHPTLSLRKAEPTSAARAAGFNKNDVYKFFDLLEELINEFHFKPEDIYNMDETGISIVPKGASTIVAEKGVKQVGIKTSAERGKNVTAVICASAAGTYLPLLFIFPRKTPDVTYLHDTPPGTWAEFEQKGWITDCIFFNWMKKFIKDVNASVESKKLLLLDGHPSHRALPVIELAEDSGVKMLMYPPHTTHKLQPLDVGFMNPVSTCYTKEVNRWMKDHFGSSLTIKVIGKVFGQAFTKTASMDKMINAFRTTGNYPVNRYVFNDEDFVASERVVTSQGNANYNAEIAQYEQVLDEIGMTLNPAQQTINSPVPPAQQIIQSENQPTQTIDNLSVQVRDQTTLLPNAPVTVSSPEALAINLGSRRVIQNNSHSSISPTEVQNSNFNSGVTVSMQSQSTSPVTQSGGQALASTAASGLTKKGLPRKSRTEKTAILTSPEYIEKKKKQLEESKKKSAPKRKQKKALGDSTNDLSHLGIGCSSQPIFLNSTVLQKSPQLGQVQLLNSVQPGMQFVFPATVLQNGEENAVVYPVEMFNNVPESSVTQFRDVEFNSTEQSLVQPQQEMQYLVLQ